VNGARWESVDISQKTSTENALLGRSAHDCRSPWSDAGASGSERPWRVEGDSGGALTTALVGVGALALLAGGVGGGERGARERNRGPKVAPRSPSAHPKASGARASGAEDRGQRSMDDRASRPGAKVPELALPD